ncbi:MAG: HAD family hydrolase [Cyanobium sp.]
MALEALLWDVDGTLAEPARDGHRLAFNRAFAEAGVPIHWDPQSYGDWLAIAGGRERIRAALRQLETREPDPDRVESLQARKQVRVVRLLAGGILALRPGVEELLAAAAAAGLRQAIVTTSGRPAVGALLEQLLPAGADGFSFWVCGDDVSRKKPHPEAYLQAAAGLACVVTRSHYGAKEPLERFAAARAVLSGLGGDDRGLRGPACAAGTPTLSYLQSLL